MFKFCLSVCKGRSSIVIVGSSVSELRMELFPFSANLTPLDLTLTSSLTFIYLKWASTTSELQLYEKAFKKEMNVKLNDFCNEEKGELSDDRLNYFRDT